MRHGLLTFILMTTLLAGCRGGEGEGSQPSATRALIELKAADPDPGCRGLPGEKRVRVLGFELGSCLVEAVETARAKGFEIRGESSPETPANVLPFILKGYAGPFPFTQPEERSLLFMFNEEQVLFAMRSSLVFKKDYDGAKEAFAVLERTLAARHGTPEVTHFAKRWRGDRVYVELRFDIDMKSSSSVVLTYYESALSSDAIGFPAPG